ncbi:MAG: trigger factor [Boseongicola sp. SB0664_bin_43]|uniref:Trigger factor n=1 Tax=Boseongicola sp. SB0664_bin_43 TaxID=2604844 RepID=A0A6B0Y5I6_9RHOB|nr:trigger factor [Boseongicola sp. SB0664_bin_43]MYK31270.1 trigger factor [Boseongicola sp. SB0670_bin_30]
MQVTETLNEGFKRGYRITVTASELDEKVNGKLAEAAPEIQMKGFRKGKVPTALLKKQFGKRLLGEAMQESVDAAVSEHFKDSDEKPAMEPKVEMQNQDWKEGDDVELALTYEALPEIPEVDFAAFELERLVAQADEAAVNEVLEDFASRVPDYVNRPKSSKAVEGDQLIVDFTCMVDDEVLDEGAGSSVPLVLGMDQFVPGFEAPLFGAVEGESRRVEITFPKDHASKKLAGKLATFQVTVTAVQEPKPAPVDDELAKKFGAEDLKGLKERAEEAIKNEGESVARSILKRALFDELDKVLEFDLPPSLVEREAEHIARQLWHDEHPEVEGHDQEEIKPDDEHKRLAERRVRLGLLLSDLGERSDVTVTDAEMNQAVISQARTLPGRERDYFDLVQSSPAMRSQIHASIFEEKLVDYVLDMITIKERKVSKDELFEAFDALDDE